MYKSVIVMPKKAAFAEISDDTTDYIICTMDDLPVSPADNILHLSFADTIEPDHPCVFTKEHARRIYQFMHRQGAKEQLCVCCDSGESRSPAIAAAVLEAQKESAEMIWKNPEYHPNKLVHSICNAVFKALS